ncbi:MAG TPA: hypothetical protein DCZ69_08765 [Syntrophobacteraceae bacterium]|nr:hypothetical protein [Syntrophobacteraceae bacterium]HBZ54792.1 hypothetical protein [Syntrophobacteraceae bacterium]
MTTPSLNEAMPAADMIAVRKTGPIRAKCHLYPQMKINPPFFHFEAVVQKDKERSDNGSIDLIDN